MANRQPVPLHHDPRQRGSVFLICLVLITLLTLSVSSYSVAAGSSVEVARDGAASLQAELTAESAMAFALRQITLDPEWAGTGGQTQALGEVGNFQVEMVGSGPNGGELLRTTGLDGDARFMLQAEVDVGGGGPGGIVKSCGLVTYGGAVDTNNVHVTGGNLLVVDDHEGVLDWSNALGDWVPPAIGDPSILANNVDVAGTLYTYESTLPGITADDRVLLTQPVRTPHWDMDAFLVANPNSTITTSATLSNITTTKTMVVKVPAGAHITINKCNLKGGLVVYAESNYDPRSSPRNTIEWKSSNFGSASATGMLPKLGILAPAAHVTHSTNQTSGYGLFMVQSADHINNISIQAGALYILDYVNQLNNVDVNYDPSIWSDELASYLDYGNVDVRLLSVQEYYPAE